ncbi:MAG: hypothetical protein AAF708_06475 [Deinococcota bacterium]
MLPTDKSITWRHQLLRIDCTAGIVVGIVVLSLHRWLSGFYQLPVSFVVFLGIVNLTYGTFSLSLAVRNNRPQHLVWLLIRANMVWGVLCIVWVILFWNTATVWGIGTLLFEAVFVGGLGIIEWRWRHLLLKAPSQIRQPTAQNTNDSVT